MIGCAIAHKHKAHRVLLEIFVRKRHACAKRHLRAHNAVSAQKALLGIKHMHRAAFALRNAGLAPGQFRHDHLGLDPVGEHVAVVAIAGDDAVAIVVESALEADGDRFLADIKVAEAADLTHAEWLGLLIDREAASRETKRFESRMRTARLRHVGAAPEDVDYKTRRGLDKALFQQLLTGRWIRDKRNLMITGPCGVGKTWLACALAQAACREGVTVLYKRVPRLFDELEIAHADGRFPRLFRSLTKTQLLIFDDWGPDRLNANQRRDLMEIVEDRYGAGSILITSQLPLKTWHEVIGEPTFADAILDRLVHNAYRLELEGQSFRKRDAKMGDEQPQN